MHGSCCSRLIDCLDLLSSSQHLPIIVIIFTHSIPIELCHLLRHLCERPVRRDRRWSNIAEDHRPHTTRPGEQQEDQSAD